MNKNFNKREKLAKTVPHQNLWKVNQLRDRTQKISKDPCRKKIYLTE